MYCGLRQLQEEAQFVNSTQHRIARAVLTFLLVIISSGCTTEKDRLDAEVRRLCALDGGVKIYETVVIAPERFDEFGSVHVPDITYAKPGNEYYYERNTEYLVRGNPELLRSHTKLVRRADAKLLGEAISYARRGGDLPGPWHPSSFRCPQDVDIAKKVFRNAKDRAK
jgi:hypothetical protein